ncbi:MAG: hypothetical protein ACI857_003265 [Arenicella sp.]|jgi:hypothetical protein
MNLPSIKKILFARTQQRLISELKITLQTNYRRGPFMTGPMAEMAMRVSHVNKVKQIVSDVYNKNLKTVEFNAEDEMEMQTWARTMDAQFTKEWITGSLLQ